MSEQNKYSYPPDFDPDALYEQFPSGESLNVGPEQGYGRTVRINDPLLFGEWLDDPDIGPTLRAFCGLDDESEGDGPVRVFYTRFASSTAESERFLHKPVEYLRSNPPAVPRGGEPETIDLARLQSLVMHHERSLAWRRTMSVLVVNDDEGAQVMHKKTP
jgi:hypothetical protein